MKYLTLMLIAICSCNSLDLESEAVKTVPTRGVWLTNVDSEALFSRKGIQNAVELCHQYGFNTIFVVTWNRGYTLYPSSVMQKEFGISIDPKLIGRDPLKELIAAAHAKNIKVFAWFEFGFSSSYKEPDGGHLIRSKPTWAAIDSSGNIVSKNGFQWMNAFNPEVRIFLLSLLKEVVQNYDLDGIQGDDRLPALPSEAGYDDATLSAFQKATAYQGIPPQFDTIWVNWRAAQLNLFMKDIYTELKKQDSNLVISVSPSIYPWSKEQYLQDWPTWVREGWVDMVCPQIYRYDIEKYKEELNKIVEEQVTKDQINLLAPGILLKVGDYIATDTFLSQMVDENRKYGINGEVFFFYEGLKRRSEFFQRLYQE